MKRSGHKRQLASSAVAGLVILTVVCVGSGQDSTEKRNRVRDYENLVQGWMSTLADEPPQPEIPITRSMSGQQVHIAKMLNQLQSTSPNVEGVGLLASLNLWLAERAIERASIPEKNHNYQFLAALRLQIPQGSPDVDVIVLGDKSNGKAKACFTLEYYRHNRDVIRGAYPENKYEVKLNEPWLNFTRLSPLGPETPRVADPVRRISGPIINSRDDLKQHLENSGTPIHKQPMNPPSDHPIKLEYNREQLDKDLSGLKAIAKSIVDYEEQVQGSSNQIGGIALGARLEFAEQEPTALYVSSGKLYAQIANEDLEVEGLDPVEFAVLLRSTVLAGEPPVLSIGSEPSQRQGYQKVTYIGAIRNCSVGAAMLKADVKLKGLLQGIGMGPGGSSAGSAHELLWSFPDARGVRSVRMWLTGRKVRLERQGNRLVTTSPGLILHYEMLLRDQPVKYPELDEAVEKFNKQWPLVAEEIPEFRQLESLALASALARWVGESRCFVAPELWMLPFDFSPTPGYVPAYFDITGQGLVSISGGVSLLGDAPQINLGLMSPFVINQAIGFKSERGTATLLWLGAFIVLGFGLPVLALDRLRKARISGLSGRTRFIAALRIWLSCSLLTGLIYLVLSEFLTPGLIGSFNAEFVSLIAVLVVPACLLHRTLSKQLKAFGHEAEFGTTMLWLGFPSLGLCVAISLATMSAAINTLLLSSIEPSSTLIRVCNLIAAPANLLGRPLASEGVEQQGMHLLPRSILSSTRYRFYIPDEFHRVDVRGLAMNQLINMSPEIEIPILDESSGPLGSTVSLLKVAGPGFVSKHPVFSVDGKPPY